MGQLNERLWFRDAIEGLYLRDLKDILKPDHHASLRERGIDLSKLLPAYPVATFRAGLEVVGPLVAPNQSPFDQQLELGRRLTRGYFDTFLGRALSRVMAMVGPDRGITRIGRSFRSFSNYIDARLLDQKVGGARVSFSPLEGLTGLLLGVNQESGVLLSSAGKRTDVSLESEDGEQAIFRFEWTG
jgi:uncharacterized protein (TIGR02265 family)